jgi:membrane protein DedA with SNARE-associated domain
MHPLATAGQPSAPGAWAYLVVFAAAAAGYMGVPVIGTAVISAGAVLASQGELNIAAVLIVAAIGCEIGGLGGFGIGGHWGRQLLEHPGPALEWREKAVTKGEEVYQRWGRAAIFVTPSIVSGALDMKFRQCADQRLGMVMRSLTAHLHAFVKGVTLTEEEWCAGHHRGMVVAGQRLRAGP